MEQSKTRTKKRKQPTEKRKPYTKRACSHCKASHAKCSGGRPCERCISLGKSDSCQDSIRKKREKKERFHGEFIDMRNLIPKIRELPEYDPSDPRFKIVQQQSPIDSIPSKKKTKKRPRSPSSELFDPIQNQKNQKTDISENEFIDSSILKPVKIEILHEEDSVTTTPVAIDNEPTSFDFNSGNSREKHALEEEDASTAFLSSDDMTLIEQKKESSSNVFENHLPTLFKQEDEDEVSDCEFSVSEFQTHPSNIWMSDEIIESSPNPDNSRQSTQKTSHLTTMDFPSFVQGSENFGPSSATSFHVEEDILVGEEDDTSEEMTTDTVDKSNNGGQTFSIVPFKESYAKELAAVYQNQPLTLELLNRIFITTVQQAKEIERLRKTVEYLQNIIATRELNSRLKPNSSSVIHSYFAQ